MKTADFDFDLPPDRIAQRPAEPRESARLLDLREGIADRTVRDLTALLSPDSLLVVNDTRVIPAQLEGRRGEGRTSITLHKAISDTEWLAFARPAKRLKPGDTIVFGAAFQAEMIARGEGGEVRLRFDMGADTFHTQLAQHGKTPIPPYIKRGSGADARDRDDYQTMFAARDGAVAAPTAGLHFTPELMAALDSNGIEVATVTLHVGAGTFLPVTVEDVADHRMHAEYGELDSAIADRINQAREDGRPIVSIGTTALRLLESAVGADGRLVAFRGDTRLFCTPGFEFRAVDQLLTNFHLPRSTLFMLVCAFAGTEHMRAAYAHAVAQGYRFFSYGDATLLKRA
ncbi:MAG: tRNA preQ1(34) S-adenosylmethionine ribosyltransferase-isomerase QueA [Alphaproteobacteria bacterium]|nr:tRNA preQ1(34) S-adenosylmethionine ribosyltransferase-isomerase QueA [Alphaproteobacteria bacterium]